MEIGDYYSMVQISLQHKTVKSEGLNCKKKPGDDFPYVVKTVN